MTTPRDALLAIFDIHHDGGGDLPADINAGLMRSEDNGESWRPMKVILDYEKAEPDSRGNRVGAPTILVDTQSKTVFVAALWSKGNRGWNVSGPGITPDETEPCVLAKSTNVGLTWSKPTNIASQIKEPKWRLCYQGPEAGIQFKDGLLVFPAQFCDETGIAHSCFIISR